MNLRTTALTEFYQVVEPGTITDVRRTKSGKVTEIEARNEVTGKTHWYTARRDELTHVHTGYFKKRMEQSKPYELLLQAFQPGDGGDVEG